MNYKTKDMFFATVLLTLEYEVVAVERSGKEKWFEFNLSQEEADKIVLQHLNRQLEVNSKKLFENLDAIKAMIYS